MVIALKCLLWSEGRLLRRGLHCSFSHDLAHGIFIDCQRAPSYVFRVSLDLPKARHHVHLLLVRLVYRSPFRFLLLSL